MKRSKRRSSDSQPQPLSRLFPTLALLFVLPLGKVMAHELQHASPAQTELRIAHQGWGDTDAADLGTVLESVARAFGRHFPNRALEPVVVMPGEGGPVVLYERTLDGAYVVRLSARDGRWFQFVYQFAHELCHIYSNFDNKLDDDGNIADFNQWFEESVCEAASLYTLRALARSWASAPPGSVFARHAADLRAYAEYFMQERHRQLPATKTLALWYRVNQHHLAGNPYHRQRNELVAGVLLPQFEANPESWEAIAYLNPDAERANLVFERYLEAWREACPEELKGVVEQIIAAFDETELSDAANQLVLHR